MICGNVFSWSGPAILSLHIVWTVMAAHLLVMLVLVFSGTDGKELPSKCVLLSLCNVVDMYCPVDERFLSVKY